MPKVQVDHQALRAHMKLKEINTKLDLPAGFLSSLLTEGDDWSFVIKTCALVETAVTDHLLRVINQGKLDDRLRKLPLSQKLEWTRELGSISGQRAAFTKQLSVLRNRLAHQIRRIPDFSLQDYVDELQPDHREKLTLTRDVPTNTIGAALRNDRYGIWLAALLLIVELEDQETKTQTDRETEFERAMNEVREANIEALYQLLAPETNATSKV